MESLEKALEISLLRKSAEQGDADAQHEMGGYYSVGLGVEKSQEQAIYWWRKAAEQGHEDAQKCLETAQ